VGFRLDGVVRRNFHQMFLGAAYDEHDGGLRMAIKVTYASREFDCLASPERGEVCPESGVLWTRNPEIPIVSG